MAHAPWSELFSTQERQAEVSGGIYTRISCMRQSPPCSVNEVLEDVYATVPSPTQRFMVRTGAIAGCRRTCRRMHRVEDHKLLHVCHHDARAPRPPLHHDDVCFCSYRSVSCQDLSMCVFATSCVIVDCVGESHVCVYCCDCVWDVALLIAS